MNAIRDRKALPVGARHGAAVKKADAYAAREGLLRSTLRSLARRAVLALFDRKAAVPVQTPASHILLVRWDGKLGDAFVSSFLYREAKRRGTRVSVVTTTEMVALHTENFGADLVIGTARRPGLMELYRLAQRLKGVDTVVHLTERLGAREIFFLRMLYPRNVFSLDDIPRWVNGKLGSATASMRFDEKYAEVLQKIGMSGIDTSPLVPAANDRLVAGLNVVFNPFGSRSDKSISAHKAISTLSQLASRYPDWQIGVLNCAQTRARAQAICNAVGVDTVRVCEDAQSISAMIDVLWAASVVISVDTSVVHIASGMRKPLLAIYPLISADFNPWLPPPQSSTVVVHSPVDPVRYGRTGLKDLDNYLDEELFAGVEALTH
jgi:ADP-heptose:LPS heptosyltransferase